MSGVLWFFWLIYPPTTQPIAGGPFLTRASCASRQPAASVVRHVIPCQPLAIQEWPAAPELQRDALGQVAAWKPGQCLNPDHPEHVWLPRADGWCYAVDALAPARR